MDVHYRVAIFGSARIKEGDREYRHVYEIAKGLGLAGFDVVTGGGPGLMQAANAGHKSAGGHTHSIGLNIKLPHEQMANKYLDIKEEFDRFSGRLDTFMALSDAVVVATGGIGTLLELFYTWQLVQVKHLCDTPIILFGEMWGPFLDWLRQEVLSRNLFSEKDLRQIFHLNSTKSVVELITTIHADREKNGCICSNYKRYHVDIS